MLWFIGEKEYIISQIKFERIDLKSVIDNAKAVKGFNVRFITPVYFNTSRGNYPVRIPMPSIMVGNLINLWNSHADNRYNVDDKKLMAWVEAHVYMSGYNLRSVRRTIGKEKPVVGGLGNASYSITMPNTFFYEKYLKGKDLKLTREEMVQDYLDNCRWVEILFQFGEYMNIGSNRTAGMGVIRYYPKRYAILEDFMET